MFCFQCWIIKYKIFRSLRNIEECDILRKYYLILLKLKGKILKNRRLSSIARRCRIGDQKQPREFNLSDKGQQQWKNWIVW